MSVASGGGRPGSIRDERALSGALERQRREIAALDQQDVVIGDPRRLLLRSPNGTFWAVTVDDSGAVSTANMGSDAL